MFIPGGGWFYLASCDGNATWGPDALTGAAYLGATALLGAWLNNGIRHRSRTDINFSALGLVFTRWIDVSWSAETTARRR